MSINKVILIGHVGQDPDIRVSSDNKFIANFSLATTEKWKDKTSGQIREETEWHRCVAYGRTAEIIAEYVRKGSKLYIEGRLKTNKWQGQDGVERYTTSIILNTSGGLTMLDRKPNQSGQNQSNNKTQSFNQQQQFQNQPVPNQQADFDPTANFDDDIPF